jgi:hypothetical protein
LEKTLENAVKLAKHKRKSILAQRVQAILECRISSDDQMDEEACHFCAQKWRIHFAHSSVMLLVCALALDVAFTLLGTVAP